MSILTDQITATLLPGMSMPEPLRQLFLWIEQGGRYRDTATGRVGSLQTYDEGWSPAHGTMIMFAADDHASLKYWFGHDRSDVLDRVCVFARSGGDGSMAAFWLDEADRQRIVHLGSGSGSTLVCVLADDAVDFLRLLAIGYDEICWSEAFARPPDVGVAPPNLPFRAWVEETFGVVIPQTALELVPHPAVMGDTDSPDPFWRWVQRNGA